MGAVDNVVEQVAVEDRTDPKVYLQPAEVGFKSCGKVVDDDDLLDTHRGETTAEIGSDKPRATSYNDLHLLLSIKDWSEDLDVGRVADDVSRVKYVRCKPTDHGPGEVIVIRYHGHGIRLRELCGGERHEWCVHRNPHGPLVGLTDP